MSMQNVTSTDQGERGLTHVMKMVDLWRIGDIHLSTWTWKHYSKYVGNDVQIPHLFLNLQNLSTYILLKNAVSSSAYLVVSLNSFCPFYTVVP